MTGSSYGDSFFDVYDEWYADAPTDSIVQFVAARVERSARVLELGVGTGRVALPLALAGFGVTGLDSSTQMLDILRSKDPTGSIDRIIGSADDPAVFPVRQFDVVLAVFNLLFNLETEAAQRRCFEGVAATMKPTGRFIVESFVPEPVTERRTDLVTRSVEPNRVILIATDSNPSTQTILGNHIELTNGSVRLRPWTIRVATPTELDSMADAAGLELTERFENFDEVDFTPGDSAHHVSVYRLANDRPARAVADR